MTKLEEKQAEYIPYGEEWKDELMKLSKLHIISLYRMVCLALKEDEEKLKSISALQEEEVSYPKEFVLSLTAYTQFYIDKMFETWQMTVKSKKP